MKQWFLALCVCLAAATQAKTDVVGTVTRAQMDAYQATGFVGAGLIGGEDVIRNARVFTREFGSIQIRFIDDTDLLISPNSSITIDEYVFSDSSKSRLAFSLTKGALRMISGRMNKPAQTVSTTVALIGIRGTRFWLNVDEPGILKIWTDEGTVVARPVQSDQEFVFQAPVYAECTPTTCAITDAPPTPEKFPDDLRSKAPGR